MHLTSLPFLFGYLIFLILLSGFFSSSETGMLSLNRYRLRHLSREKHRGASRVEEMLKKPDKLLGVILIGNTFANILASAIATIIAVNLFGEKGVLAVSILLTFVVLIFAEVTPKTLAALYPMRLAFLVSLPLKILLKILYPFVWCANMIANGLLRLFGIKLHHRPLEAFSKEELKTVLAEAKGRISAERVDMLTGILDLEKMRVDDIMVPRNEVIGIDLNNEWKMILEALKDCQHTRLPVYSDKLDNVQGVLHTRLALHLLAQERLDRESMRDILHEAYFIPEGTSLYKQLIYFRDRKQRLGFVVDEYGDMQGLITLEDILEEVVGKFTTDIADAFPDIYPQKDGSYLVDGMAVLRDLNRSMDWGFPTDGPKTLSGLIIEKLEMIPNPGTCIMISNYPVEVVQVKGNRVKTARVLKKWKDKGVKSQK